MELKRINLLGKILTLVSLIIGTVILYILQIYDGNLSFYGGNLVVREPFLSGLLNVISIFAGLGVTFISIYLTSGKYYSAYRRFKDLGIEDGDPSRRGRELELTNKWLEEIKNAKRSVTLIGVTLGGWFCTAWDDLKDQLPTILRDINSFEIYVISPFTEGFHIREKDEKRGGEISNNSAVSRARSVFGNLLEFICDEKLKNYWKSGKVKLYLYKGTPMSVVWIDDVMYLVIYLPYLPDKECPQMKLISGGKFAEQIKQTVERLKLSPETQRISKEDEIREILSKLE